MRGGEGLKVYGSGLLSSRGEIVHCIESPEVQRYPIQLEWVINQGFEIDHYQPLLFIVDSFDHLFSLVDRLEIRTPSLEQPVEYVFRKIHDAGGKPNYFWKASPLLGEV